MLRVLCFSLIPIFAVGCAAPKLTGEGAKVIKLEEATASCLDLGLVQGRDVMWGDFSYAETHLKNEVAKAGGNAYVIQYIERVQQMPITAKAYKCKSLP